MMVIYATLRVRNLSNLTLCYLLLLSTSFHFFHNFVKPCGGDSLRHGIPSTSEKQKEQISYGVITHTYLSHALSPFLSLSIIDEPSVAGNRLAERDSLQSL